MFCYQTSKCICWLLSIPCCNHLLATLNSLAEPATGLLGFSSGSSGSECPASRAADRGGTKLRAASTNCAETGNLIFQLTT